MKPLRSRWNTFEKRLKAAPERLLLLDFDGTLAAIEKQPEMVKLASRTHRVLERLSRDRSNKIVIVSGRTLADLKRHFHLKRAFLVGNHGLEASPSTALSKNARQARRTSRAIGVLATKLRLLFDGWPGVRVENKKFTLSLHYRNLPAERQALLNQVVDFYRKQPSELHLVWRPGKKVWEIRPDGYRGKADVVANFMKKYPKALPVAFGDDFSDEEMFEALGNKGVSVRVGKSHRSCATCSVRSPGEVRDLLEVLTRL